MIKEKLMQALKTAAADYNNGMGADLAVACAAEAWDFNEKQAERLVEMFNTAAALNKEKDKEDPTGACELADKEKVASILLDRSSAMGKSASASKPDVDPFAYSFYGKDPVRTNPTIEARASGMHGMAKAASAAEEPVPRELDVSQRSLFKVINEKIAQLKEAADAADDVARNLAIEAANCASKVAKAIESPFADPELADMFKAACHFEKAVESISGYSTKVAESGGGRFAKMHVFDDSKVADLLKTAGEIEEYLSEIPKYESRRDFYFRKASEAEDAVKDILGMETAEKKASVADFFEAGHAKASMEFRKSACTENAARPAKPTASGETGDGDVSMAVKLAEMIRKSGVQADEVARLAEDLEKDAATSANIIAGFNVPSGEAIDVLAKGKDLPEERKTLLNVRRSILLADLMANDPILRDADPNIVAEAYKTMVMTSPRVSLDKSQVRAFLRSAANSVAISPSDAKVISDVDRGIAMSNVERLTALDSSIKDSNKV